MGYYQGKVKGRRKAPYPNSILDRKAFTEALEVAGISVKRMHMDEFYKILHKQNYPPLREFAENYYANQRKVNFPQQSKPQERNSRRSCNKMTLPKNLILYISTTPDFVVTTSRVKERLTSKDDSTTKLIIELYDGFVVESVLMRYRQKGAGRASLCVSSQCGCAMGCTFCATGTMGLSGNLTVGEILEQLVWADRILLEESLSRQRSKNDNADGDGVNNRNKKENKIESVRNVVFMGMGEPLDNYNNVTEACRTMIDNSRWNLSHGRVTVSTVGLISAIRRLTKELPQISLALSLHAPNQETRAAIVPTASRYPIEELIGALDNHMMAYLNQRRKRMSGNNDAALKVYTVEERMKESSRRRAMIEYVMLQGESTSFKCAHQLGKLCENRHLIVNLIPYNSTDVKDKLQCPSYEHMLEFRNIVQSYGTFCTIRRTMGADIASACGQLVQKKEQEEKGKEEEQQQGQIIQKQQQDATVDIEDVIMERDNTYDTSTNDETSVVKSTFNRIHNPEICSGQKNNLASCWTESFSNDDLDRWSRILTVATTISATFLVASSVFFLQKRRS